MKKNLLTLGVLAISLSSNAQQEVLMHVGTDALFYVSPNTLVYNGGGLETKTTGKIENHGNIMIVGSSSSVLRTVDASNAPAPTADRIVLKANDNSANTYGQLYIEGIPQSNITAIVDREYAATNHGAYQQIGIPFLGKSFAELNTELGGVLLEKRWSGQEILKWNNNTVRMEGTNVPTSTIAGTSAAINAQKGILFSTSTTTADKGAYYIIGTGGGLNFQTLRTIKGTPYASEGFSVTLSPASITNYGTNGTAMNVYREKYNTYISDPFDQATPWQGNFGKNIHQFSNPYLTNIDLSYIGTNEVNGDNNYISNIQGVVINPNQVVYDSTSGGTTTYLGNQMITFNEDGTPVGAYDALLVRPFGTFRIKLKNNTTSTLNFDNLRRFAYTPRTSGDYSVTAARTSNSGNTVKQLGIIALDANGNKIGETFYAVAPNFTTGNATQSTGKSVQAFTEATGPIHTYEEDVNLGGVDANFEAAYRLYINEANEVDFKGKKVALGLFDSNVKALKFVVSENASPIQEGVHELSSGTGFYYTKANGQGVQIKNGDVISVNGNDYGVYYGAPSNGVLASNEVKTPNRTLVVYNPDIENYIIRFDPAWKSADVFIYDMSGKLVHTANKVKTSSDYVLTLDKNVKTGYVVKVVSENGTTVNAKLLTK